MSLKKRIPRLPDKPLPFIAYLIRHCSPVMKRWALLAYAFEIGATAADVLVAWVLGRIVGVIIDSPKELLWNNATHELALLVILWTARNACYRGREFSERRYVPELLNTARELLFSRLVQQSQDFLQANFAGVLANHVRRAGDVVASLRERVQHNIIPLIVRFLTAGALLWNITPAFSLFILSFIIIGVVAASKTAKHWTQLSVQNAETSSRLSGYIVDSATNISAVRQEAGWREEKRRFSLAQDDMTDAYKKFLGYVSWFWGVFDTVMTFFFCSFMALVVYGWQQGSVSTGSLAMTVGLVTNLFGALAGTVSLLSSKFGDIGILQEALHKISSPLSVIDVPDAPEIKVFGGKIEFRSIRFGYLKNTPPIFDNLSISILPGQKVGIVGVSGAGKTTLCQLLLRGWDVQEGGIFIDSQNISKVTQDSLHQAIAVIPQEPMLFHRSLADNIRYGRQDASDEEIRLAATAAEAAGFIEVMPYGYSTLVGERGVKLSGGQRQRIAIARAIVKNAPILVLDEATSALDSETEKSIQSAMLRAMQGRTTVVIAHRLSTLRRMDRIIVMDKGHVMQDGGFDHLLETDGIFSRLWQLQAGGFLPEALPEKSSGLTA